MDPLYEQRLRDEVIFLHSLWHQGPPGYAASDFTVRHHHHHLHPSKTTLFKKGDNRGRRGKKGNTTEVDASDSSSAAEWPCPTPPPPLADQWPSWGTKPHANPPQVLSPWDQLKIVSRNVHKTSESAVSDLFGYNKDDDSDAIDSESDEDNDDLTVEDDGGEYYCFFLKVFKENAELKEYYEKNFANGEFTCLVCGASGGKKVRKKYQGCIPLVQHSITIAKTKRRRAHRALGQAICKVLGWDIDRLPHIVSMLSTKAGEAEVNLSAKEERSVLVAVENVHDGDEFEGKNGEAALENEFASAGVLLNGDGGNLNSLVCNDARKGLDDPSTVHPSNLEVPLEGLTNNSWTCPDTDKDVDEPNTIHPHDMDTSTSEGLTSVSGKNSQNHCLDHPENAEEPASSEFTTTMSDSR